MSDELACYAVTETISRGREFPEKPHPYRSCFERDRDRIIHSYAFRRLEGKTQVFTTGVNDSYRTRLTHSLEVAQIGRTIAKNLKLNEELTEAICLAHDLGHPPFGHSGEQTLNELMSNFGGFEHNRQGLRIVELLEHPYPNFAGLNLMYETRLGLAKHRSPYDKQYNITFREANCSLEGQVADLADRIAYNCHDLEDGIQAGLLNNTMLYELDLFGQAQAKPDIKVINDQSIKTIRTAKTIIDYLVSDCIVTSSKAIDQAGLKSLEDVYTYGKTLITLSPEKEAKLAQMEKFLLQNFYQNRDLINIADKVKYWLGKLFDGFCKKPVLMPAYYQKLIEKEGFQRTVCDYIAGMTDGFCRRTVEKIETV